jgi:hypothetical protein
MDIPNIRYRIISFLNLREYPLSNESNGGFACSDIGTCVCSRVTVEDNVWILRGSEDYYVRRAHPFPIVRFVNCGCPRSEQDYKPGFVFVFEWDKNK